ncbi:MAG: DUF3784 domain-containing protein [Lachnospiraceae bacterium]|nr:DUF3784 domain-containing protein [Lachnospiraceae bacterium]
MTIAELIIAILIFAGAGVMLLISIRSFLCKGFLMNNAYLYASKQEREQMDKKPYYRQTAIVFLLLSIVFVIVGVSLVLHNDKITLFEIPVILGAVIYAIVSTIHIKKRT